MARTAQKVESLIAEDPDLADAIGVVVDRTNGGDEVVEWGDVNDDLTSGQWGRLIETGVLVDRDDGFTLADPDDVRDVIADSDRVDAAVAQADTETDADTEDAGWTIWDKAAAVATLGLFAGYSLQTVRSLIGGTIDLFLGPLDAVLPFYAVVLTLALLTGLYSTLLQANLMDMDAMGEYQERMKDIQERQKAAKERGDDEAVERIRQEQMDAMGDQLGMFKLQFRPMVWIMLLTIPVFLWMYWMILEGRVAEFEQHIVVPIIGEATWRQSVIGPIEMWIVWYFLCSMAFTQIIRKALNIQTTPT